MRSAVEVEGGLKELNALRGRIYPFVSILADYRETFAAELSGAVAC